MTSDRKFFIFIAIALAIFIAFAVCGINEVANEANRCTAKGGYSFRGHCLKKELFIDE